MFFDTDAYAGKFRTEGLALERLRVETTNMTAELLRGFKKTIFTLNEFIEGKHESVGELFYYLCVSLESLPERHKDLYVNYLKDSKCKTTAKFILHCIKLIHKNQDYSQACDDNYEDAYYDWEMFARSKGRTIKNIVKNDFKVLVFNDTLHEFEMRQEDKIFYARGRIHRWKENKDGK